MKSKGKKGKRKRKKEKILVQGDDAIETFEADWLDFKTPAIELARQLRMISESSGVCCGILGPWGCGKSSFMKLMDEYIRKESSWKNVHIAWFTAWDPAGIQDLGDAMLYHFFCDVVGKNKEMASALKELQQALGIRRSFRERAGQALKDVSGALPTGGRAAATVASGLLREFDAPRKVQASFEKLMKWLEKEKHTVFFFIDDIDRATGEQIRDLLSELKLYVSNRRIIAVLAYDQKYVINALKDVLPPGTDPRRYLEKIVTMRRNVPIPDRQELVTYAYGLLQSMLGMGEKSDTLWELGHMASTLSNQNPRRLKTLILTFTQFATTSKVKLSGYRSLASLLIATAAASMNFLAYDTIRKSIEEAEESRIISSIESLVKEDPSKLEEAKPLISAINEISPRMGAGSISWLRLARGIESSPYAPSSEPRERVGFNWRASLIPILSSAAMQGFRIPSNVAEFSEEVIIPSSTESAALMVKSGELWKRLQINLRTFSPKETCVLSWKQTHMLVLLTSSARDPTPAEIVIGRLFGQCAHCVTDKSFVFWVIDDGQRLDKSYCEHLVADAKAKSRGLKHPFIFVYTPASKVSALLEFLLGIVSKQG